MKKIIDARRFYEGSSNGAILGSEIFRVGEGKYKVSLRSEAYENQSYLKLYKWSDKEGFSLITSRKLKTDYNFSATAYESFWEEKYTDKMNKMFEDMIEIAKKFE